MLLLDPGGKVLNILAFKLYRFEAIKVEPVGQKLSFHSKIYFVDIRKA